MAQKYLTRKHVRERYSVADRTIARWIADAQLGFPQPMIVNRVMFFSEDEIVTWERSRASNKKAA